MKKFILVIVLALTSFNASTSNRTMTFEHFKKRVESIVSRHGGKFHFNNGEKLENKGIQIINLKIDNEPNGAKMVVAYNFSTQIGTMSCGAIKTVNMIGYGTVADEIREDECFKDVILFYKNNKGVSQQDETNATIAEDYSLAHGMKSAQKKPRPKLVNRETKGGAVIDIFDNGEVIKKENGVIYQVCGDHFSKYDATQEENCIIATNAKVSEDAEKRNQWQTKQIKPESNIDRIKNNNEINSQSLQNEFETSRTDKLNQYDSAINEIKKSAVFNIANTDMMSVIKKISGEINGWVGTVKSITTSHGGTDASISIISSNNVIYRNDSDIPADTSLYNQLSALREGQSVKFSGNIMQGFSVYEHSVTERGSLNEPEFHIDFSSITPIE